MTHEEHCGFDSFQEVAIHKQLLLPFELLCRVCRSMVLVSPFKMTLGRIVYMVEVEGISDHPPQKFFQFDVNLQIYCIDFETFVDFP